ncbi:MAG: YdgA family protein, partial [Candidatus Accumulibacter sp.]|nr:YdgA family protein [Accumulibacter sp.]
PNALIELYKQSLDEHDAHTLEEITAKLIDLGYATEENDALKTRLVFTNGQLLLNDKPFNPLSLLF